MENFSISSFLYCTLKFNQVTKFRRAYVRCSATRYYMYMNAHFTRMSEAGYAREGRAFLHAGTYAHTHGLPRHTRLDRSHRPHDRRLHETWKWLGAGPHNLCNYPHVPIPSHAGFFLYRNSEEAPEQKGRHQRAKHQRRPLLCLERFGGITFRSAPPTPLIQLPTISQRTKSRGSTFPSEGERRTKIREIKLPHFGRSM